MTKHLFLLIGKNPLPNYVAAKLLIEQDSTIHFVYTTDTEIYKKNLITKLKAQLGGSFFTTNDVHLTNPSNAIIIRSAIETAFKSIPNNTEIDLNYTGGTKVMSVHVYRAIEEFGKQKSCTLRFSYLDPRELKLIFDSQNAGQAITPIELSQTNSDGFPETKILLEDLMNLHDLAFVSDRYNPNNKIKPKTKEAFPFLVDALFDFSTNKSFNYLTTKKEKRNHWIDCRKQNSAIFERPKQNSKIVIPTELGELIPVINQESQRVQRKDWVINNELDFSQIGNGYRGFAEFLYAKWLESYVLRKIIKVKDACFLDSFGRNLSVIRTTSTNKTSPFFEVDVYAIRGYQLFAISCTVDSGKRGKHKLFEISHRAKQLGGDEARIGLVCMADSAQEIENELEETNIKVFGKSDLPTLEDGLQKWFDGK
jgi:hypothetical protein